MSDSQRTPSRDSPPSPLLLCITAAAILFGLWGRFKGLATWSLADDEYYIARSVEDILRVGIPAYECGGLYLRGLPYQYLAALLQLMGLGPELSLRIIAAATTMIVLPAVYLLGRRVHSANTGLLAVAILAASVWEIEMGRFGRMYSPFQAVFVWYLLFFLRYVLERDLRALWAMVGLSLLGGLVWEGGIFLMALNLLPPFIGNRSGRLPGRDWGHLAAFGVLALPIAWLASADSRYFSGAPFFPADYAGEQNARALGEVQAVPLWQTFSDHPAWLALLLVAVVPAGFALRWIWSFRPRWLAVAGLGVVLVAGLLHQLAAVAAVLVLLLLMRIVDPQEIFSRRSLPLYLAILLGSATWFAFAVLNDPASGSTSRADSSQLIGILLEFARLPDFPGQIVRPWVGAASLHGLALLLLLGLAVVHALRSPPRHSAGLTVLVIVVVALLVAVGLTDPPRQETRYIFFLYPVIVLIAVTTASIALGSVIHRQTAAAWAVPAVILCGFMLMEDFMPRHVLAIDSAEANFRIGYGGKLAQHFHPRGDTRGAAEWINEHARATDLVINGAPAASFYSGKFDYAYLDWTHRRFEAYACRAGTVERWGNLPLLYTVEAVAEKVAGADRAFMVVDRSQRDALLRDLARWHPQVVWTSVDRGTSVLAFEAR